MFVAPVSEVLVATGMARMKQTASLIEGLLYLTFVFCFSFSAMVNIMRVTRSADREAGASTSQPEGDTPQVEQSTSGGNLSGVSVGIWI